MQRRQSTSSSKGEDAFIKSWNQNGKLRKYLYRKVGDFPRIHFGYPLPHSKSDKTLYTGIYLPTFREGTNFIIKLLVFCALSREVSSF